MNSTLAIAALTWKTLWRMRILPLLAIMLPAGAAGLGLLLQGDGTPSGEVRLWLEYAAGWMVWLLSVSALAAGAGAVSLEVSARSLDLLRVKPVSAARIWAGKWCGLMLAQAGLLLLAGLTLGTGLQLAIVRAADDSATRGQLRREFFSAAVELPAAPFEQFVEDEIFGGVLVPAGGMRRWRVYPPPSAVAFGDMVLQYRCFADRPGVEGPLSGAWQVGPPASTPARLEVAVMPGRPQRLELPAAVASPGGELYLAYANLDDTAAGLVFPASDGPVLVVAAGSFAANLARAGLMIMARLAFLTALGVTAGAAFSFPVALFTAAAVPLLELLNRLRTGGELWLRWLFGDESDGGLTLLLDYMVAAASRLIDVALPRLPQYDPRPVLLAGRMLGWSEVGRGWAILALYTGGLALAGILLLRRRNTGTS